MAVALLEARKLTVDRASGTLRPMEPLDSIYRWSEHVGDRARVRSFFLFLWRRVLADRLFAAAGAPAYATVFALVPLSMVVFGILSAFPAFEDWSDTLTGYVFTHFVPSAARQISQYVDVFTANIGKLTTAGVIALVLSLMITLNGIEGAFNRIWRVRTARPKLGRILVYWTVLTLGTLVAAASLALSTQFFALSVFSTVPAARSPSARCAGSRPPAAAPARC